MAFSAKVALTLSQLSELAYEDDIELIAKTISRKRLRLRKSPIQTQHESIKLLHKSSDKTDTECIILKTKAGDIVVSFRGSENPFKDKGGVKDWIWTDLDAMPIKYPLDDSKPGLLGIKQQYVHKGFWKAYKVIRKALLKCLEDMIGKHTKNVYITGHSLGGSLALHAAMDISQKFSSKCKVYTFGAPRVGNANFAKALNKYVAEVFLFVNKCDKVYSL